MKRKLLIVIVIIFLFVALPFYYSSISNPKINLTCSIDLVPEETFNLNKYSFENEKSLNRNDFLIAKVELQLKNTNIFNRNLRVDNIPLYEIFNEKGFWVRSDGNAIDNKNLYFMEQVEIYNDKDVSFEIFRENILKTIYNYEFEISWSNILGKTKYINISPGPSITNNV